MILLSHFGRPKGRDPEAVARAGRGRGRGRDRAAGRVRGGLRRRAGQGRDREAQGRRRPAAGEHPLPCRRGEERSGLRARAGGARRHLRERRLLGRTPGARLDRGTGPRAAGLCGPQHAGRARRARQGAGSTAAAGRGHRRRRQGVDQARAARQPDRQGRRADHRRRHGQYVPGRAGQAGRQIPGRARLGRHRSRCPRQGQGRGLRDRAAGRRRGGAEIRGQCALAGGIGGRRRRRRHDPGHRPAQRRARRVGARAREDAGLERAVRRLRAGAVRHRHGRGGGGGGGAHRRRQACHGGGRRRHGRRAQRRRGDADGSPMCRPRAAPSWSGWKARPCRVWRY